MRNSDLAPPISKRDTDTLLEDLCIALRNVAVFDRQLPNDKSVRLHIEQVCEIKRELDKRGESADARLMELSTETRWRMRDLLEDCLRYPETVPFVKDIDGIRRTLRCGLCGRRERPVDARLFWWCNECFGRVLRAIDERTPIDGVILFRSYNADARCQHANSDTVLVADSHGDVIFGNCSLCLEEELARRNK